MTRRTREEYNWLKCEFDDQRIPASWDRYTSPRREKIQFVVAHHMVIRDTDPNDDEALAKCLAVWKNRPASAHYGVDNDFVAQFVSDYDAAWATADTHGNHAGISIEHVNKTLNEEGSANDYLISEKTWKTGAKLAAYLHRLYKLGRPVKNVTLRKHSSFFATSCPGPYFDRIWDDYVKEAQRVYDSIGSVAPVPTPKPPTPEVPVTTVTGIHWNIAGSDTVNGYKKENATRGDDVGRWVRDLGFEVFLACEAGQASLLKGVNSILGTPYAKRAKAIWLKKGVKLIASRKVYSADGYSYLNKLKWGAGMFGEKNGKKYAILEVHLDWRTPAKQSKQLQVIFKKFIKDCDALKIPRENIVVCGDFNTTEKVDNPFKALADWGFVQKSDDDEATFIDGRHLDGVLAHKNAKVSVARKNRWNLKKVKLSDHYIYRFVLTLK